MSFVGHSLDSFNNLEFYQQHFLDVALWSPCVRTIGECHHLEPLAPVRTGVAGSFPTFIVADSWVVKFFGQLFDGPDSFTVEHWVNQTIADNKDLLVPGGLESAALLASGTLDEPGSEWSWPYLVFAFLPGRSIGEVFDQITMESKRRAARNLGQWVRKLHDLDLDQQSLQQPGWPGYADFLREQRIDCARRHREWGIFPAPLLAQIDDYLLPVEQLANKTGGDHLIHADLTRDHLLGTLVNGEWHSNGIIDFGDAMPGNLFYELGPLYLDMFSGQKPLLNSFLDGYGYQTSRDGRAVLPGHFSKAAMTSALLHRFNVFEALPHILPDLNQMQTLEQVAERLWAL